MAFADHLDLDTFVAFGTMGPGFTRDAFQRERIDPIVIAHLVDLRDAGSLAVIDGTENRDIRFADAWNAFLAGTEILWQNLLWNGLGDFVLVHAIKGNIDGESEGADPVRTMADAYALVCRLMDAGDLVGTTFHPAVKPKPHFDDLRCGKTGDRCRLVVEGWQPRLERFDRTAQGYWVPLEAVAAPVVQTIEIDLPTGVLLMSDYLRMPGVHAELERRIDDAIGDDRYSDTYSVNSERGHIATTRLIAEVAHVLEVSTTNTMVAVHQSEDRLVVIDDHDATSMKPTIAGMIRTGDVCCDRWTVLLADRQDVVALMGTDEAALDTWLASDEADAIIVNVTPGRWRVSFGEALRNVQTANDLGIDTPATAWFSMQRIA